LDAEAKAEWKRIVPQLSALGLLTLLDRAALTCYCQAWSELQHASATLAQEGHEVRVGESGAVQPHPAVAQQRSAWKAVRDFASLFGLDPSSRSRLKLAAPSPQVDDFERFLSERREA
jgi:P27 family predicted phage terminase small subunit